MTSWKGPKIVVYLTVEEKTRLEKARIKAGGKAMSEFAKGLLFHAITKQRAVRFDPSRPLGEIKQTDAPPHEKQKLG